MNHDDLREVFQAPAKYHQMTEGEMVEALAFIDAMDMATLRSAKAEGRIPLEFRAA